jgi:hypothetical protein
LRSSGPTGPQIRPSDRTEHPDPNVPDLIAVFVGLHHETLSQPYLPNWARDGACLKRAVRTWKRPDIERAMTVYFSERDARLQFGADIPAFVKRIATLLARDVASTSRGFVG